MADSLHASLAVNLGSLYFGSVAAAVLFGITSLQTFIYFKHKNSDQWSFKALICFLWILDSLHIAFIIHIQYHYTVAGFTSIIGLLIPIWTEGAMIVVTCINDLIVRAVFAHRIWRLSRKKVLYPMIITILSLAALAGGFGCAIQMFFIESLAELYTIADSFYVGTSTGVAADFFIAASMVYLLVQSHTGFKHTDTLVNILMLYAINTGLFTTVCRLMGLITYAVWTDRYIFFGIYYILPELSLNALLATLNARESLRRRTKRPDAIPLGLSIGSSSGTTSSDRQESASQSFAIHVDKEVTVVDI